MPKEFLNPPALNRTFGWTHVVATSGGKTIHVSGQAGIDERGQLVSKDLKAQTERTFENLKAALAAAGATFRDVVNSRVYVVGFKPEYLPIIREVRSRYFAADQPPASTLVGVTALAGLDWLIEIEVTAVVED
ncbi:MAG TPA: RidA family protein [Pirellulaceae bacterium]|nr:RidA family protein [Pirellulaceae bacterium]